MNEHKNLTDPELHEAKGHSSAENNTVLVKTERGVSAYEPRMVLPPALNTNGYMSAPATENDGDVYILTAASPELDINTIAWQSVNKIRYTFNGMPNLSVYNIGDYLRCKNAAFALNNGRFVIVEISDEADWIDVTNMDRTSAAEDEATDCPGTGSITLSNWDGCGQGEWARFNVVDGKWYYIESVEGMLCFNNTTKTYFIFKNGAWIAL